MKPSPRVCRAVLLALFLLSGGLTGSVLAASAAVSGRTDINPALVYYQAILEMPGSADPDSEYVSTNDWRRRALDRRFAEQMARYDSAFRLLHQAARQQVPCDWGYDLTPGPEVALPSLAKARSLALTARLRSRWHLENGRPEAARDDLLSAFVLGRQLTRDGVLISVLVRVAIENILVSGLAENWFRFPTETLQQVVDRMQAAPASGTAAQSIATERSAFRDWLMRRVEEARAAGRSEDAVLREAREAIQVMGGLESEEPDLAGRVLQSAGGTSAGLIRSLRELDPLYAETAELLSLPYDAFAARLPGFGQKIASHTNLFAQVFFRAYGKCRQRELTTESRLAMVRAALAKRLPNGAESSAGIDPLTAKPFGYRRFEFQGADRGFELATEANLQDFPTVLIFVERDGPPFYLDGPNAGKGLD